MQILDSPAKGFITRIEFHHSFLNLQGFGTVTRLR